MLLHGRAWLEATLLERGRRLGDPYWWGLQGEGFRLGEGLVLVRVLGHLVGTEVLALLSNIDVVVVVQVGSKSGGHGGLLETRCIGRRLGAQLREVQVGAGTVTDVHGFMELTLRAQAVEDNGVEGDCNDFDNNFNEGAYQ